MRRKSCVFLLTLIAGLVMTGCSKQEVPTDAVVESSVAVEEMVEVESSIETESTVVAEEEPEVDHSAEIEPVEGLSEDFVFGCDMSMLIAQENSGVVYYNEAGEEQDPLLTLANNGVDSIRIRIWNDPYDENGNGYGGGNNDTATAIAIGQRVTEHGMTAFIDYHYSDFWADPKKQMLPKAWVGMTTEELADAIYAFTKDSLGQILAAGVDVSMVQLGNEITNGMCGENNWTNICMMLKGGCQAVRELEAEYGKEIQIVMHFANPHTADYQKLAMRLEKNEVDYDIFATSYYPFWNGTLENMQSVLQGIVDNYGKKVMVAEISYPYTFEDGDNNQNSLYENCGSPFNYEISEQGQAEAVRDCVEALAAIGDAAVGIFYWEPAWIPVPDDTGMTRSEIWEKYGSGWASSYASVYDPNDAGKYYGGSAWDNQALFDHEGNPLSSIQMFNMMKGE